MRLIAMQLLALVALTVSSIQWADKLLGGGATCSGAGDCATVTSSDYSEVAGVPLPALGMVAFLALFTLLLIPQTACKSWVRIVAILGGVVGLSLIAIQAFLLQQFCPLCLTVDVSALLIAILAAIGPLSSALPERLKLLWLPSIAGLALLGMTLPFAWMFLQQPAEAPEVVQAVWKPSTINIVEVMDFECEFCIKAERVVQAFIQSKGDTVHFVRMPIPWKTSDDARLAAKAYRAAEAQGKGEAMAKLLLDNQNHSYDQCLENAHMLELNIEAFQLYIRDPNTDARLDQQIAWYQHSDAGLPQLWIQNERIVGVPTPEQMETAYLESLQLLQSK